MPSPKLEELPEAPEGKVGWPWTSAGTDAAFYSGDPQRLPKITVVTPSYNQGQFIEETIRSILLQNYPNLEYFVFDGGSSDETVEILKRYEPWLDYWCSESDGGQADAVNKGFARSTGQLLNWVNSDDLLFPRALHTIAEAALTRLSDRVIHYGNRIRCDSSGMVIGFDLAPRFLSRFRFLYGSHIPQETAFISRATYEALGPLTEGRKFALDFDYWARASMQDVKFRHVNRFIGTMRFHAQSKSCSWQEIGSKESKEIQELLLANVGGCRTTVLRVAMLLGSLEHKFDHLVRKPVFHYFHPLPQSVNQIKL